MCPICRQRQERRTRLFWMVMNLLDLTLHPSRFMVLCNRKLITSTGYYCRTTYEHLTNQAMATELVKEVQLNNPTFLAADIRRKHFSQNIYV